ncbi:MAG: IS200/IS605 family accessory protein TnpB-related protein, partial [Methylocella sp.]
MAARAAGRAISYRFRRDRKGWRVFATTDMAAPRPASMRGNGAIGVDINGGHLAVAEIDRFGNLVASRRIGCLTYGLTREQAKAHSGDAVTEIAAWAQAQGKPIVIETLDFARKKAETESRPGGRRGNRRLSGFAYAKIAEGLRSAAFRRGVEVIAVNPAYTSTIGAVNYARRHGISVHCAAALAIARRGLG